MTDLAGGDNVGVEEGEGAASAARAGQLGVHAVLGGDGDGAVEAGVGDAEGTEQALVRVDQLLMRWTDTSFPRLFRVG